MSTKLDNMRENYLAIQETSERRFVGDKSVWPGMQKGNSTANYWRFESRKGRISQPEQKPEREEACVIAIEGGWKLQQWNGAWFF